MQGMLEKAIEANPVTLTDNEIDQVAGAERAFTHEVWFCEDPDGGFKVWKEGELFD